jgi:hypothetical protein
MKKIALSIAAAAIATGIAAGTAAAATPAAAGIDLSTPKVAQNQGTRLAGYFYRYRCYYFRYGYRLYRRCYVRYYFY